MGVELESRDYVAIALAILFAVGVGVIVQTLQMGVIEFENAFRWVTGFSVLVSLVFVYRAAALWGGDVARALTVMGVGFAIFMLHWVPHIGWHLEAASQGQPLIPLLGIDGHFILGLFHAITASAFLLAAYGFYLFYQAGSE